MINETTPIGRRTVLAVLTGAGLAAVASACGGVVTFQTIVPGCYPGRWPHVHFEVFESIAAATATDQPWATSQLAFPAADIAAAYAAAGYESSSKNLGGVTLSTDNVFGDDGGVHQLAAMQRDPTSGYTASLTVSA